MITAAGVKLMDFGVAKLRERETLEGRTDSTGGIGLTEEGAVLGSFPYMSPEQLEGRDVDGRHLCVRRAADRRAGAAARS
jgi:serine/threonine protein kinase